MPHGMAHPVESLAKRRKFNVTIISAEDRFPKPQPAISAVVHDVPDGDIKPSAMSASDPCVAEKGHRIFDSCSVSRIVYRSYRAWRPKGLAAVCDPVISDVADTPVVAEMPHDKSCISEASDGSDNNTSSVISTAASLELGELAAEAAKLSRKRRREE